MREVQYFTQLAIQFTPESDLEPKGVWSFTNIAIVKFYAEPDADLLHLSLQVLVASILLDDIFVCNVKKICSIVAMIPHTLTLLSGVEETFFCMMEKPGVDISDLGIPYSIYSQPGNDDDDGNNADVD